MELVRDMLESFEFLFHDWHLIKIYLSCIRYKLNWIHLFFSYRVVCYMAFVLDFDLMLVLNFCMVGRGKKMIPFKVGGSKFWIVMSISP